MKFEKGNKLSTGRPKGSTNVSTTKIRESFEKLISDNIDGLQEDLDTLEPQQRLKIVIDLAAYVIPKLRQSDITADIQTTADSTFLSRLMDISEETFDKALDNDNTQMK